jgi:hypothetical protein
MSDAGFVISRVLAARRHPDLIAERANFMRQDNTQAWDKRLAPLLGIGSLLALVVVGLDALYDCFLQAELEGYREYAGRVRYRLLPGVW